MIELWWNSANFFCWYLDTDNWLAVWAQLRDRTTILR
jgi:hypothetical protein